MVRSWQADSVTRHPDPTVATVKHLYGTATRCASPTCSEPLYRTDPEISGPALNSTVAHICAASPEGPRYDPGMSPEENRSASNLLLLCRFHSALIDAKVSDFSAEKLQEWKTGQLAQGGGTAITDEQAQELIRVSLSNEIVMQAEVINVGGQWGGGGGAVGAGAVGGPGGDRIHVNLDGLAPGGGGGVLFGPGRTPRDGTRAKEGRGFSSETDGGDSYVADASGKLLAFAQGGAAASSPYDQRRVPDGLSVSSMMVCNSVEIRDRLLYVLGGSWQSYSLLNTPGVVNLVVALVIEAGGVEAGHYSIHMNASGPDGSESGRTRFPVVIEERGDILRLTRWVPLTLRVKEYGLHTITVMTDKTDLTSLDLAIKRVTDAP